MMCRFARVNNETKKKCSNSLGCGGVSFPILHVRRAKQSYLLSDSSAILITVPAFVLRIRSAHLETLGFPMGGAY